MNWIKEHPYMAGGVALLLVVLLLVFRKSSGSSTQVIQTGPSDAATAAGLQAQVQLAGINAAYAANQSQLSAAIAGKKLDVQTALALTSAQKDVALQGILSGSQVQSIQANNALLATQYSTQAAVQAENISANRDVTIAGTQADVQKQAIQDQLAQQGIISKATVDVATIQGNTDRAQTEAAKAVLLDTIRTNLAATQDTNATNVSIAGISGDTSKTIAGLQSASQDLITRTAGNIYTDQIDTQGKNISDWIAAQLALGTQKSNVVNSVINSGQINKGGEGGSNQVSVLDSYLGNLSGGTVAAQGAAAQGVAGASMWSNILGGITSAAAKIFG